MLKRNNSSPITNIVLLLAIVLLATVMIGCDPAEPEPEVILPPPDVEEWILPVVASITGDDADQGMAAAWGFSYGVITVNEQEGIRGVPVIISVRDAASIDAQVSNEMRSAAIDSLIVVGPSDEELFKAGQLAFYSAGMPAVGAATDDANRKAYAPFAISCIADPGTEAISAVGSWIQTERFTSVYLFYSPLYSGRVDSAKATLTVNNKTILGEAVVDNEAFDAVGAVETAFALGPDAYYLDLSGEDSLRIIRQLRFLAGDNASKLKIICGPGAADLKLLESAEEGEMIGVRVWATLDPNKDSEKRKAFDDAFEKNVGDYAYYNIAVDYYQSAIMIKQAMETLGLMGSRETLADERLSLAEHLYNSDMFITDQGNFVNVNGNKETAAKLYKITDKGFQ